MALGFDTADDAAEAALLEANPLSRKHEYAGAIYEKDGRFFFTKPQTSGSKSGVNVKVAYPKGSTLAALYHTHPHGHTNPEGVDPETFSRDDVSVAKQFGIPYYLGVNETGAHKVFRPDEHRMNPRKRTAIGSGFLAQIPIDSILERVGRTAR